MPPCAPSTVRAQACEMLGEPSLRVPSTNSVGKHRRRPPPSRRTAMPSLLTPVTVAVVPLTSGLPEGPQRAWSSTRSPARYSRSAVHPGPARAGPVSGSTGGQVGADAVGQVLGVGVGDDQRRHLLGPVAPDVGAHGLGHRLRGSRPGWPARAPSPARPAIAWDAAASPRRSRPSASRSAESTWRRLTVRRAEGMTPVCRQPLDVVGRPAGADWLGLARVAQHP